MARPKGSKNKVKGPPQSENKPYRMTPDLSAAIENVITEMPNPPKIEDHAYPSNWNEMGKIAKLEWLTANPRK